MEKYLRIFLTLTMIVLVIFLSIWQWSEKAVSTVEIGGVGKIKAMPDKAILNISFSCIRETTGEAVESLKKDQARVLDILLNECGISKDDIKTSSLNINTEYSYENGKQEIVGRRAYSSYSVTIYDMDNIGNIYDLLSKVDGINLSNLSLGLKNEDEYIKKAREAAIDDALSNAKLYAGKLNRKIGKVLLVKEGNGSSDYYVPSYYKAESRSLMSSQFLDYSLDDIEIRSDVFVIFEMK